MSKGLEALAELYSYIKPSFDYQTAKAVEDYKIIEKELKVLIGIEQSLKYGYVFIGYDKDNEPLFQFADTKLYEEIKKNMTIREELEK